MNLLNILTEKEVCPYCGSENVIFSKKARKYKCEDCEELFEKPKVVSEENEYKKVMDMISEEPPVDVRKVKAFLASSTALENERSAVTTEIARLNGQKTELYINMYHCEQDDTILPASSQQEEYNKRIDECDLFLLLIDNSEIGDITLGEIMRAAAGGKRLAAFVRKGTPDGGKRNIRWQEFIGKNREMFAVYCEYDALCDLEKCADELYSYVVKEGENIGSVIEKCSRHTYNICLTGTDGCADEFIYAIGDMFNTVNNRIFEEDELCSLVFRLNIAEPASELPEDTNDYYFIVRRKNENMIQMIKGCYDRADPVMFLDVNVFDNGNRDSVWETISAISSEIRNNYLAQFGTREKLVSKRSIHSRIEEVRDQYHNLINGIKAFRSGNYFKAEEYLLSAAKYHFVSAYFHLGIIYNNKDHEFYDIEKAVEYYRLAADKGHIYSQINLGMLLEKSGRKEEAEKYLRIYADNGNPFLQNNLGVLLMNTDRTEEAEKYLRLAADKDNVFAQYNLGVLLKKTGRIEEAEEYLRLAADKGDVLAQFSLGVLLKDTGRIEEAEKYLCVSANQDNINAQKKLAVLLSETNRLSEAEKYFRIAADKGDVKTQFILGILLRDTGRKEEAEKYYRLAADKGDTNSQFELGVLLYKSGRISEAEEYLRLAADKGYVKAQKGLVTLLYAAGREKEALKYLDMVMQYVKPNNKNAVSDEEAEKKWRIDADNGNVRAQLFLAILLERTGSIEEAEKYYRLAADNGDVTSQSYLGVLLYDKGETEEAEKYLVLAAEKNDFEAQYNLGCLYENTGRPAEAEKYYRRSAEKGYKKAETALVSLKEKQQVSPPPPSSSDV